MCRLGVENEIDEAFFELQETVGHTQLFDAQGLLGSITADEMPEEERQIRGVAPGIRTAGKR